MPASDGGHLAEAVARLHELDRIQARAGPSAQRQIPRRQKHRGRCKSEGLQFKAPTSPLQNAEKKLDQGLISVVRPDDQDLYWRFIDGRLGKEIDEATRKHGYGTFSTGERIGAFGPKFG